MLGLLTIAILGSLLATLAGGSRGEGSSGMVEAEEEEESVGGGEEEGHDVPEDVCSGSRLPSVGIRERGGDIHEVVSGESCEDRRLWDARVDDVRKNETLLCEFL